ncbi:MAG: PEP/pyruvate-binding domain-containing protein [Gemmatimonadota bacterium]|nr:PEP/pyruvate-binding domain-containing protein [Gemmatimonadota bacterium]
MVPLADAGKEGRFGGKSASLSQAIAAGLPVPPGRALSVDAVESVVRGDEEAVRALEGVVDDLGGCVAVRSSAIGEDAQDASFAGQHSTLLNVRTHERLVHAVREVYQSAHSASALAYRKRMGVSVEPRMGVAVQQLVDAESAGVLFTHNPATGEDERLIEAAWGLGEAVVSGIVIPDSYRITSDGSVVERTPGHKDVALRPGPEGGIEEIRVEAERVDALCLSDAQLQALHVMTLSCEAAYGDRLDIEWAFADRRPYLLQCRSITR